MQLFKYTILGFLYIIDTLQNTFNTLTLLLELSLWVKVRRLRTFTFASPYLAEHTLNFKGWNQQKNTLSRRRRN